MLANYLKFTLSFFVLPEEAGLTSYDSSFSSCLLSSFSLTGALVVQSAGEESVRLESLNSNPCHRRSSQSDAIRESPRETIAGEKCCVLQCQSAIQHERELPCLKSDVVDRDTIP